MTRRYFVPDLPFLGGLVSLPEAEAQHASRVMRVQVGDDLVLFDGRGNEATANFVHVGRKECHCQANAAQAINREPKREIHLAIALPKPDRSRELIERLTEMGVCSLTPLIAQRTQRPPTDSLLAKLRRGVIEACKQSGRNQLLNLKEPMQSDAFFRSCEQHTRWIAHPAMDDIIRDAAPTGRFYVAIGPEGGWTDDEVQLAVLNGFRAIDLGARTYRIETAATAIAAVLAT
jgi:16S rRNA (uracil1498-N3)-methyltransferase